MKTEIHPEYGTTEVVCSCGNTFTTRSTAGESLHVELCNECHPFFTGKQKLVDSGGRVERFKRRYGKASFTPGADETPQPEASAEVADAAGAGEDAEADAAAVAEEASEAEA